LDIISLQAQNELNTNLILLSAKKYINAYRNGIREREVNTFSALLTLKIYLHFLWLFIPIFSRFSHQITVKKNIHCLFTLFSF